MTTCRAGFVARSTVQLGKHLAALMDGTPLIAYDPHGASAQRPSRARTCQDCTVVRVVAASGEPPSTPTRQRLLQYGNVPQELAHHLYDLFSR